MVGLNEDAVVWIEMRKICMCVCVQYDAFPVWKFGLSIIFRAERNFFPITHVRFHWTMNAYNVHLYPRTILLDLIASPNLGLKWIFQAFFVAVLARLEPFLKKP